jgi:hypothetical protein
MTRNEEKALWAIALTEYGAESLERKVLGFFVVEAPTCIRLSRSPLPFW